MVNEKGSRQRDTQRKRLYAAEDGACSIHLGAGPHEAMSMTETRQALAKVVNSRWFRQRFRLHGTIALSDGRGTSHAFAEGGRKINMPRWTRQRGMWVLLHELAHIVVPGRFAWHGPEFAKVYLALVDRFIGKDAGDLLRAGYALNKVSYRTSNIALTPRYEVATQAQAREQQAAKVLAPLSASQKSEAAETLRRGIKQGMFGATGTKTRVWALVVARILEKP